MAQAISGGTDLLSVGLHELKRLWGWYLALGLLLIAGGLIAIGSAVITTEFSVMFVGCLLMISGLFAAFVGFSAKSWSGFFIDLLIGLLYLAVGFIMVANPAAAAVTLTLIIALFLIFAGIFRTALALAVRFPHWGWVLVNGIVSLVLGVLIWQQWPLSGLWVIGLFVGIEILFHGWSLVMLALAARKLPATTAEAAG